MQGLHANSDDSQMFDAAIFEEVALVVNDGSSELDDEIDRAIGVVMGLRTAVLYPGAAINRAALAAADDWLRRFQSPLG